MDHYVASAGLSLAKRATSFASKGDGDDDGKYNLSALGVTVVALTTLAFLPLFVYVGYSLKALFPALAMVEDPDSPGYTPVALNEEDGEAAAPATDSKPTTSSLRRTNRLLFSVGGWRSNFRGIMCLLVISIAMAAVTGIFVQIPLVPGFIGSLLASLALVQLNTAWVHIVISNPSDKPFWRRLPPFRQTFEATCIPVFILWLASSITGFVPALVATAIDMPLWRPEEPHRIPKADPHMAWKGLVVLLIVLALWVLIVIPAEVILVRVQASLLPPEEDPIIAFDRSFGGVVEPSIVGGKGYVSWKDALKTFPRSSWVRLYILYGKVFLISWAVYILYAAVIIPEAILLSQKKEQGN